MSKIIVAGNSTGVGKTIVSAILVAALQAEYWKPVQSGCTEDSDTETIKHLVPNACTYPPAYNLQAPLSPHHAARLENIEIDTKKITPPHTHKPLIIESVGGILVPLSLTLLTLDLFAQWEARWIVVSRHYLGSINHTLLTVEALKRRKITVDAIVFNGNSNPDTEQAILHFSGLPCLGRLAEETNITANTIQRMAAKWKERATSLLR